MTNKQRAVQLWSVLALAARSQQILSYTIVQDLIGVPQYGLAPILGSIQAYCDSNGLPPLTSIVVNEPTGLPGHLYPGEVGADGIKVLTAQSRVFVFNWLGNTPSEDDFKT